MAVSALQQPQTGHPRALSGTVELSNFSLECGLVLSRVEVSYHLFGWTDGVGTATAVVCGGGYDSCPLPAERAVFTFMHPRDDTVLLETPRPGNFRTVWIQSATGISAAARREYGLSSSRLARLICVRDFTNAQISACIELGVSEVDLLLGLGHGAESAWEWAVADTPLRPVHAVIIAAMPSSRRSEFRHDIGRKRGGVVHALGHCRSRLTLVAIDGDSSVMPSELASTARMAAKSGLETSYIEYVSGPGLVTWDKQAERLARLLFLH